MNFLFLLSFVFLKQKIRKMIGIDSVSSDTQIMQVFSWEEVSIISQSLVGEDTQKMEQLWEVSKVQRIRPKGLLDPGKYISQIDFLHV